MRMSISSRLGLTRFEVGIIAGSGSVNLALSPMLPDPDDSAFSFQPKTFKPQSWLTGN